MKPDKKHTDLKRPAYGNFGRNEWSITGTDCESIKQLAGEIIATFSTQYICGYIDARHPKGDKPDLLPGMLNAGARVDYSNEITHAQVRFHYESAANLQQHFTQCDLLIINGNHHQAKNQIIVIDEKKKASLQKRIDGLDNVKLILLKDESVGIFDFVSETVDTSIIPILPFSDLERIISFFKTELAQARPPLFGLVLAGGKSVRMGLDKPSMQWHGKEQRYYLADELMTKCEQVFISCREDQRESVLPSYNTLVDSFTGLGPYGAILSAFRAFPDAAWLILASDLPLLTSDNINHLILNRNLATMATAYEQPANGKPEPLIAIWEPKSYPVLLSFLARGYSCPSKVLQNNPVTLIQAHSSSDLMNVNTPADKQLADELLTAHFVGATREWPLRNEQSKNHSSIPEEKPKKQDE